MKNTRRGVFGGRAVARGFSLPSEMYEALVERARWEDRPVSWVVQKAIAAYLSANRAVGDGTETLSAESLLAAVTTPEALGSDEE